MGALVRPRLHHLIWESIRRMMPEMWMRIAVVFFRPLGPIPISLLPRTRFTAQKFCILPRQVVLMAMMRLLRIKPGLLIGVTVADCVPILIYDQHIRRLRPFMRAGVERWGVLSTKHWRNAAAIWYSRRGNVMPMLVRALMRIPLMLDRR